ncbi:T9SS type A sorting domain-containing protein [Fulvivirgaceae bacterium PWU4]|uniref:T9SS type A sorting domain-containing protein n=1 Tax=Chryseosolibacter histidini TaxID=2782349 RepID=A0AAP2GMD7_9BACT|nr:kelch repeat-containing protein [Chryseosolibacter histidini]MBT1696848.1 T9SS type A sorting domain-containing protein [Chryseosolibacter histidini]
MMNKFLVTVLFAGLSIAGWAQTFTVVQNSTGNPAVPTRGQSFRPSSLGAGSGSTGASNKVILKSFRVVYHIDAVSEASKMYIYSAMPSNATTLTDGTSGTVVAESISKTDDFPYTVYNFNNVELDKNTTYYALFREDVGLESASSTAPGPYDGGQMIRNNTGTLAQLTTADLRMTITFEQFPTPSMTVWYSETSQITSGLGNTTIGGGTMGLNVVGTKTFTIKNGGPAVLNIGTVTATGTGVTVSAQPAATVNAGGSTTFEISFSSAVDTRIAYEISIPSNNPLTPFLFKYEVTYDYPITRPANAYAVGVKENQINVYWEDRGNEDQFSIERSLSSGSGFQEVGKVPGGSTLFADNTVTTGVTYYYRVRGIRNNGDVSAYVNTGAVTASVNKLGDWEKKASYPGIGAKVRVDAIGFSIGQKGYFGLGYDNSTAQNDFWEYDPARNTWERKADFPGGGREASVEFVINGKAYVGLGFYRSPSFTYTKDFYVYDPATNTWSPIAEFPGVKRAYAAAFVLNGKAYVGLGFSSPNSYADFYEYDPVQNTWRQVADFPKTGNGSGFAINNTGYVYMGTELYAFDPSAGATGTWTKKADLKFSAYTASNFVINNKAYVVGGSSGYVTQVYDPSNNTWSMKEPYPSVSYQYTSAFVIDNKGYAGLGSGYSGNAADLWEYSPVSPKLAEASAEILRNKIVLTWKDNADDETGYVLERAQSADPQATPQDFTTIANLNAGQLTYTDVNVVKGTFYTYRIRTKFTEGVSQGKSVAAAIEYPTVSGATKSSETSVNIQWTALTPAAVYVVERATSAELNTPVSAFTAFPQSTAATSYTATMSSEGFYHYRIKGTRMSYPTATLYSDTAKVLMIKTPGVINTTVSATSPMALTWEDRSSIETGYVIQRKESSEADYTTLATLAANATSYTDNGAAKNKTYQYRVKAVKGTYDSFHAYSNLVTVPGTPEPENPITGVEQTADIFSQAYPNPAKDVLIISTQDNDLFTAPARVVAADGRGMNIASRADRDAIVFDVHDLQQGLYVLIINAKKGIYKFRFAKD